MASTTQAAEPAIPTAEPQTEASSGPPTLVTYVVERTAPERLLRHDISDEELGSLGDMRRDYLWEGKWVALGLAMGAAPNAIAALHRSYATEPAVAMGIVDLVQIILMFVGFAIWAVLFFVVRNKTREASSLVTEIRERTARRVQG